jgi:hypothetical protein
VPSLRFALLQKYPAARKAIRNITPNDTPTPIPTLACCDRPWLTVSEVALDLSLSFAGVVVESEFVTAASGKIHPFNGIPLKDN